MAPKQKRPPVRFLLDTSWMVALVCAWHEHHPRALLIVQSRLSGGERLFLAAPAIAEAYAVLTRLPPPHRLSAKDAWSLLSQNFQRRGKTVSLDAAEYWSAIEEAQGRGIAGGRFYDFLIGCCARKCQAKTILTFNVEDFQAIAPEGIQVSGYH